MMSMWHQIAITTLGLWTAQVSGALAPLNKDSGSFPIEQNHQGFVFLASQTELTVSRPLAPTRQDERTESYVENQGVKLHCVSQGSGPLVVMIHGFPDYWYTWRDQMAALAPHFQAVAYDQRGYNLSDQPAGVEHYTMTRLVADLLAVVDHFGSGRKAIVVGHDWGGAVAWSFAMQYPDRVDKLVILNLPHPRGLIRELLNNPQQRANSQYAVEFQKADAASRLSAEELARWVADPAARRLYVEAFERSSFEGMLNYYKANYPRVPTADSSAPPGPPSQQAMPNIQCPVLIFHGLDDQALLAAGLNDTWEWVDAELTIVTIPGAGHFVQQDASDRVSRRLLSWLRE